MDYTSPTSKTIAFNLILRLQYHRDYTIYIDTKKAPFEKSFIRYRRRQNVSSIWPLSNEARPSVLDSNMRFSSPERFSQPFATSFPHTPRQYPRDANKKEPGSCDRATGDTSDRTNTQHGEF